MTNQSIPQNAEWMPMQICKNGEIITVLVLACPLADNPIFSQIIEAPVNLPMKKKA